jgi:hypothetical protein
MSVIFDEGRLRFEFASGWSVLKWDEDRAYWEGLQKLGGARAVDFAGVRDAAVWLIEVKDFRGYRVENKRRIESGELAQEIVEKVRDTIAGLVWACDRQIGDGAARTLAQCLFQRNEKVRVVLWMEGDTPVSPGFASALAETVKSGLRWLSPKVLVRSLALQTQPDVPALTVANLPHSPMTPVL